MLTLCGWLIAHLPFERTFTPDFPEILNKYHIAEAYEAWAKKFGIVSITPITSFEPYVNFNNVRICGYQRQCRPVHGTEVKSFGLFEFYEMGRYRI